MCGRAEEIRYFRFAPVGDEAVSKCGFAGNRRLFSLVSQAWLDSKHFLFLFLYPFMRRDISEHFRRIKKRYGLGGVSAA